MRSTYKQKMKQTGKRARARAHRMTASIRNMFRNLSRLFAVVLLLMILIAPTAQGTEVAGLSKDGIGGVVDIWINPYSQVSDEEIILVVNYISEPIVLTNKNDLDTYNTYTIPSKTSMWITLRYPWISTEYTITISHNDTTLYSTTRSRGSVDPLPIPIDDGSWRISPPSVEPTEPDDELQYSKNDWKEMVSDLTTYLTAYNIIILCLLVIFFTLLGAGMRTTVNFEIPWDFGSAAVYSFLVTDSMFHYIPLDYTRLWYIPCFITYIIGFMIKDIQYAIIVHGKPKKYQVDGITFITYYNKNHQLCRQEQSWNALANKLFSGNHDIVKTDAPLKGRWTFRFRLPKSLSRIDIPNCVCSEKLLFNKTLIKKSWLYDRYKRETIITLLPGSKMKTLHFILMADAFKKEQEAEANANYHYTKLLLNQERKARNTTVSMTKEACDTSPALAVREHYADEPTDDITEFIEDEETLNKEESIETQALEMTDTPLDEKAKQPKEDKKNGKK